MTMLKKQISHMIKQQGPINVSQFMALALSDPKYGYYQTQKPFGIDGDFITAPEISQMFGELLAVWAVHMWQNMQSPKSFNLCEMGPGRGTLMFDVLRTIQKIAPACYEAAKVYMVETSKKLSIEQQKKLQSYKCPIEWVEEFAKIPEAPIIILANELFDALPIDQCILHENAWHERLISLDEQDNLIFIIGAEQMAKNSLPPYYQNLTEGSIIELAPLRNQLCETIAKYLVKNTGSALIIDYGTAEFAHGDTLQAMSHHAYSDIFANIGGDDLTSHVDFISLKQIALHNKCQAKILEQGDFLIHMGLIERAGQLGFGKDKAMQQKIRQDVERLVASDQMGSLFKVMQISDEKTKLHPVFH